MFKYLAVIQDSFREALASRILWVVLGSITILLLAVAPLSYREVVTWRLTDGDFTDLPGFLRLVRDASDDVVPSPQRYLWRRFDAKLRERLLAANLPGPDGEPTNPLELVSILREFRRALNRQLEQPDFVDDAVFTRLDTGPSELKELRALGIGQLAGEQLARFNRLALETAFPEMIRSSPATSIQLTYAGGEGIGPFPLRAKTLRDTIQSWAVFILKWTVGAIGVVVAILVTAPIIPQMFDPGALHLLLSKPVSRWLLFLAKYLGGCAFILVAASYLIVGLWFLLGWRFGIWDQRLLLSIPIYLFVFAVYYAVCALAGVIWRSSITAVAITVLFWAICFSIGLLKVSMDNFVWNKSRIVRALEIEQQPLIIDELGILHQWNADQQKWDEVFVSRDQKQTRGLLLLAPEIPREIRPVGPVYDPNTKRLLSAQPNFPPTRMNFYTGSAADQWEPNTTVAAPTGTFAMLHEPTGQILLVAGTGLYRLVGDPTRRYDPIKLGGITLPLSGGSPFVSVGPAEPPLVISRPSNATINPVTGELVVYSRGQLIVLAPDSTKRYQIQRQHRLDGRDRQPVVLAVAGQQIMLGRDDGRLQILDHQTFEPLHEYQPEGQAPARFVTASPDGQWFAAVFHGGSFWLYDVQAGQLRRPAVAGQGQITAADFPSANQILLADRFERLSRYDLPTWKLSARWMPAIDMFNGLYRYLFQPLYFLFPKPGELDTTFQYLLTGKLTEESSQNDLTVAQEAIDPWSPVWSSAIFTLVVLIIACVYFETQDF